MKRGFGTDRVRRVDDGGYYLSCRHPKQGWVARRPAEGVRGEFPGSCIRWEEENYEIIQINQIPGGVRYLLRPWEDSHAIRAIFDYDEESESQREADREAERSRQTRALGFHLGMLLTGLLPARVQREMESELGVSAATATAVSAIAPLLVGGTALLSFVASAFGAEVIPVPRILLLLGSYFFVESLVRISLALTSSQPVGSFPVVLVWEVLAHLKGRPRSRPEAPILEVGADVKTRDRYLMREPFLALLSSTEQLALEERYGFDWRSKGRASAIFLIVFASLVLLITLVSVRGGVSGGGDLVTLICMVYLLGEQLVRLQRINAGQPAGSVLGLPVRYLSRGLLR